MPAFAGMTPERHQLSTRIPLTLACGDYEIIRPLKEGIGPARRHRADRAHRDGFNDAALALPARTGIRRRRGVVLVLHGGARPGASVRAPSRSSCIAASATASSSSTPSKGIKKPTDLIGKKVGVKQFQATAIVWMRGILEHEYGVPQKSIEWFAGARREHRVHAAAGPEDHQAAEQRNGRGMLAEGELDARAASRPDQAAGARRIRASRGCSRTRRTRRSPITSKTGIFPIMHVLGIKQEIVDQPSVGADQPLSRASTRRSASR